MAVSAFGMSCGYFDKVMEGKINWTIFYKKRYIKILPFFLFLIVIDLALDFSVQSLYEGLVEMTLLHGFIPRSLSVIGVGWFLGTVFIFYLIFPFFCVLIENKRRAWCSFAAAILLNYICLENFSLGRQNFVSSFYYFLAGGLVYLYRDNLQKVTWFVYLLAIAVAISLYYLIGGHTIVLLFLTISLLAFAISINCGKVGVISYISEISMEFYLSHMVIFRAIEKLHLNTRWGSGWGQYLFTTTLVFLGTILFSFCFHKTQKRFPF